MPYCGTMNNDEIVNALIAADFKGPFTLECGAHLRGAGSWPHKRRTFEADTRLLNPPMHLRQMAEALLYETAKHILSAYDLFEGEERGRYAC